MPVLNEREAERYLLLVRDIPGYDVRLTLRPAGTAAGEVIGEVAVVHTPIEADFNLQNYGSTSVGRFGGLIRAQFNGLTGLGDRTSIGLFSTADFDEQQVLQLFHDFAIGSEGLRLAGSFTYAWTKPDVAAGLDTKSRTLLANIEANYPFIRTLPLTVYGAAGFDFVNQEVDFLGSTFNRDKIRVAYVRADFDSVDIPSVRGLRGYSLVAPRWRANGTIEFRQGLHILDATEQCLTCVVQPSRVPSDTTGTVIRATAALEYRPAPKVSLWISPRAQYSKNPLLAYEEISGGNYTFGRGYDPGVITGYKGAGIQSEIRVGRATPESLTGFAFQPYAFFDAGRVWYDRGFGEFSTDLASAGGGIRAAYGNLGRLDATIAVPLQRVGDQTEKGDVRFLISFTTRLVPWSR
jgi:hemolysin activation/secretion protein